MRFAAHSSDASSTGRGAVGERRAVARGQRARRAGIESGAQLRELLRRGIGADVVVGLEAEVFDDQIVVEAVAPRGGGLDVALVGELILLLRA